MASFPRRSADRRIGPLQFGRNGPGGWWILDGPEIHLGEDVLVPDLSGWRNTRLASPKGPFQSVAPDWACEVLSPSSVRMYRGKKLRIYARKGVGHVWLVDPAARTLEVLERDGSTWRRLGVWPDDDRVKAAPFDAVEVELGLLWPFERRSPVATPRQLSGPEAGTSSVLARSHPRSRIAAFHAPRG
ncbi:MAG: Uma2 family endonuclease [Myxococcales bacterium]|jgi:Uma2 family endonuclease